MALKDNRDLVVHAHKVIFAIEHALGKIQDAETGSRGFSLGFAERSRHSASPAVASVGDHYELCLM
jgi:hypothetical protein